MWYLVAAIIGSASLVILLKLFEAKNVNLYLGITINYLVGAILSFAFSPVHIGTRGIISAGWFPISMIIGALFMISFVVYGLSAQRSGVAITTISGRAAVVIPVIFAFVALGQEPTTLKITMLALIVVAMVLILKKDGKQKNLENSNQTSFWVMMLPVAVFLFNGLNDTLVQYAHAVKLPETSITPIFMGTMFVSGIITGLIFFIFDAVKKKYTPKKQDVLWGSILGVTNWVCMVGVFNGLDFIEGSLFYPIYYSGAIVIATIVGVVAFKEKLSLTNYIGIAIALVAIVVLSRS